MEIMKEMVQKIETFLKKLNTSHVIVNNFRVIEVTMR